jgi:hypothetical protein
MANLMSQGITVPLDILMAALPGGAQTPTRDAVCVGLGTATQAEPGVGTPSERSRLGGIAGSEDFAALLSACLPHPFAPIPEEAQFLQESRSVAALGADQPNPSLVPRVGQADPAQAEPRAAATAATATMNASAGGEGTPRTAANDSERQRTAANDGSRRLTTPTATTKGNGISAGDEGTPRTTATTATIPLRQGFPLRPASRDYGGQVGPEVGGQNAGQARNSALHWTRNVFALRAHTVPVFPSLQETRPETPRPQGDSLSVRGTAPQQPAARPFPAAAIARYPGGEAVPISGGETARAAVTFVAPDALPSGAPDAAPPLADGPAIHTGPSPRTHVDEPGTAPSLHRAQDPAAELAPQQRANRHPSGLTEAYQDLTTLPVRSRLDGTPRAPSPTTWVPDASSSPTHEAPLGPAGHGTDGQATARPLTIPVGRPALATPAQAAVGAPASTQATGKSDEVAVRRTPSTVAQATSPVQSTNGSGPSAHRQAGSPVARNDLARGVSGAAVVPAPQPGNDGQEARPRPLTIPVGRASGPPSEAHGSAGRPAFAPSAVAEATADSSELGRTGLEARTAGNGQWAMGNDERQPRTAGNGQHAHRPQPRGRLRSCLHQGARSRSGLPARQVEALS